MANWQRKLDLKDVWGKIKSSELSLCELSRIVANRLGELRNFNNYPFIDEEKDEIVEEFCDLALNSETTKADFDEVMEKLYDWGDLKLGNTWPPEKVCWIGTYL